MTESPWLRKVRIALGSRPDIMLWRQHAGVYCPINKPAAKIQVAPNGIADLMGVQMRRVLRANISVKEIVNPHSMQPHEREVQWFYGQAIAIEAKNLTGTQREAQLDFEHAFRAAGGIYIIAKENDWHSIWREIGEQPDPLAASHAQEIWAEIKSRRDLEDARRKRRRKRA